MGAAEILLAIPMFPLALHMELWWDGNAMENLTHTCWEKDPSRDTATPEKNTLEVPGLFWGHCKWTANPFCAAAPNHGSVGILRIKSGIQQGLKLDLRHNGKNHSTVGWAGAHRDQKISRFLLEASPGSSSHHLWVPPGSISWVLLEAFPGSSLRHLQVPPGGTETVGIFGINEPMQLGGDKAPLTLKENWDGLETRSLSGSQDLYSLTGNSADDRKSWFIETPCRENLGRRDLGGPAHLCDKDRNQLWDSHPAVQIPWR